jgi:hypothetical protein
MEERLLTKPPQPPIFPYDKIANNDLLNPYRKANNWDKMCQKETFNTIPPMLTRTSTTIRETGTCVGGRAHVDVARGS